MTEEALLLFLLLFIFGFGGLLWGFQAYVARQLAKYGEEQAYATGGRRAWHWMHTFVLGWKRARSTEILDVMVTWSVVLAGWIVLVYFLLLQMS